MQCADIFFLGADICQLGTDQRKVNMLAREYCDAVKRKFKPVILSHPMLMGLKQGQEKMSKSDPDSAIFMEDSAAEVSSKIKKAFCPPAQVELNPCMQYIRLVCLPWHGAFTLLRDASNGGEVTYATYEALEADYLADKVHPGDLKASLAAALNTILEPVRRHFEQDANAKELLRQVKGFKVTR
jgi:tyrosyl-tRNA synthetase